MNRSLPSNVPTFYSSQLNTFDGVTGARETLQDLTDGVALSEIMHQM